MSTFLYLAVEARPPGGRWRFMMRMSDPGSTRTIHERMGLTANASNGVFARRGLPDAMDVECLAEDPFYIDDPIVESDAGDIVDTRFCTTGEAAEWVRRGLSTRLGNDRMSSPSATGHSWATSAELARVVDGSSDRTGAAGALRETVETMHELEEVGLEVRAVYWIE